MSPLKDLAHLASVLQTRLANVKKRSGRLEPFEPAKIETSIRRALSAAGLKDDKWAVQVSRTVFGRLDQMVEQGREISTADLSELIQILFIESNLPQAVRKFLQFHQTKLEVKARGGELAAVRAGKGLSFSRFFTREGTHPFDEIRWEHRDATISNEKGEVVFEQKGVEMPAFWTQTATNIVVQKYFRGQPNSIERETSVRQLISRVATTIADWGRKDGYFKTLQDADVFENELTSVLVNQRAAFNSPVWFNMGAEPRPQCSACFVNSVHDDMHSILNLTITEGILFKYGSGTGSNISNLRSSREPVSSSSGRASGPVSFMKGWDAFAGVIKSGGRTRRAAKMVILNADHPDILDFIWCKAKEEKKAHALIEMGYDPAFNSDDSRSAYGSIFYQNANNTVRLPDEFFQAAECNGSWQTRFVTTGEVCETMPAKEVLNQISEAAWLCGDPGVQYDSAIQKWHTCKNSGRINATNPCCLTGDTLIAVADGRNAVPIQELAGQEVPVYTWDHNTERVTIGRMNNIGVKRHNVPVFRVTLDDGSSFRATDDHLIMLRDGTYRQVKDLRAGDSLMPFHSRVRQNSDWRTARRFVSIGSGWRVQYRWIWEWLHGKQPAGYHIHHKNFNALDDRLENLELLAEEEHIAIHRKSMIGDRNPARRLMNDQWRANIARAVQGERNPHYGKLHTKEALEKMRAASARRWQSPFQISCASQAAKTWMKAAKALGQHIGRYPLPRLMRCCPVCRENFETIREGQLFCSFACRYSQLGLEIVGAKVGAANRGRSLSPEHKEKLRLASIAASRPEDKQRAQRVSLRARCAKAARALEAEGYSINFSQWDGLRPVVRAAGVPHAPCVKIVRQFFSSEADLREAAELYNHTITEVVFDSIQDVYDGTVDQHHNFGIVTSRCPSVASRVGGEDFSGIFVHNSEFVFLDDSACNLSSINLMKFRTADGGFDVEAYKHTIRIMTTAMEIIVDNSSYPTPAIEQNSHDFRPLGLGFANLGALLMSYGIPYDSDEGRNIAAAVSALMSGEAYWQSTQTAQALGAFAAYEENREPFMEVMRLHRGAVYQLSPTGVPEGLFQECRAVWDRMIEQCEKHGARNAQISVVAPTGCLVGDSLVSTDHGLIRLTNLGNTKGIKWQDVVVTVATDEGPKQATQFYVNGMAPTRKITTRNGYDIQGTARHQVKVVDQITKQLVWKRFDQIQDGDVVALAMNTIIGKPRRIPLPPLGDLYWTADAGSKAPDHITPELGELIGYFMGDGSLHAKGLRFCVTNGDEDVIERLYELIEHCFGLQAHRSQQEGYVEVSAHSVPLTIWWDACGFTKRKPVEEHIGKGYVPYIPDAVLATNDPLIYGAFLRGLYEADGCVTAGLPTLCTGKESFAREVRSLLLGLGLATNTKHDISGWGQSTTHVLRLKNQSYAKRFCEGIGFMGKRKQEQVILRTGAMSGKYDRVVLEPSLVEELVPVGSKHHNAVTLSMQRHGAVARQRVELIYEETNDERLEQALQFFYDRVTGNEDGGMQPTYDLSVPENVTYIANGFISHNTIAFLMDCDTTGIEPDIALVKYKWLVGGGMVKIVNRTVPLALEKLGYTESQREEILAYIDKHDTIEGAPHLNKEHLPIFDCAFKPARGTRTIHHLAHVKMMAAVQPFISGAISKTVNMPETSTAQEISDVYALGWKMGLKAIAIYRDNCKKSQPLTTKKEIGGVVRASARSEEFKPRRRRLPDERRSITHKFMVGGYDGYLTVGLYNDGVPGEIFITMSKQGSVISGLMGSFATAVSIALQYGVPVRVLVNKFAHSRFEPSGFTNNPSIRIAKSIVDYVFRWLGMKFLSLEDQRALGVLVAAKINHDADELVPSADENDAAETDEKQTSLFEKRPVSSVTAQGTAAVGGVVSASAETVVNPIFTFDNQSDAPACDTCGAIMVRNASCYKCLNCGNTSGCS